jgi:hypothetical protein
MTTEEKLKKHLLTHVIPIPWCKRINNFKPSKNIVTKHDWPIWRKMESRRSQNAAYNSCINRTETLAGMWSKLYH